MARPFRLWEKKRGHRRTGSHLLGRLGEAVFSGTLFVLGTIALVALITSLLLTATPFYQPGFGFWLMFMVLWSFVLLGGGGVIWTILSVGASAERRSAIARKAASIRLPEEQPLRRQRPPYVPSDANLTNSPGVKLRYRLPVVQSRAWRFVSATVFCGIWNTCAVVLVILSVNGLMSRRPDWFLTLFTVPFLIIGVYSVFDFVRQVSLHTGIGPTNVEIGTHPLCRGSNCEVYLSQAGRLSMKTVTLNLVCEELATYRQGTDVRTECRKVFDQQLFRKMNFFIDQGRPFEHTCQFSVPCEAMHSFQSEHNAINWKLVVRGEADAWPPYERQFPIVVYPSHDRGEEPN